MKRLLITRHREREWLTLPVAMAGLKSHDLHNRINLTSGGDFMRGVETGFMWQGITGISMPIADNVDDGILRLAVMQYAFGDARLQACESMRAPYKPLQ